MDDSLFFQLLIGGKNLEQVLYLHTVYLQYKIILGNANVK